MPLTIKTTGIEDYLDGGNTFVKALILGPPSAGKTRSASFWPKPIFADCEKGRMSIADRNVPYGEILTQDDMATMIRMLRVECSKPVQQRRFQTFVLDTLDAYQRIIVQERLNSERKEALQGFADWGYLDAKMTQLIAQLLSLPMNIVVNCHTKDSKDGDDGPLVTGVKLKGDIRDQIAAEFDLVGLMGIHWEAVGGERVQTRSVEWHPRPTAPILKDRSGRLPRFTPVTFSEDDYTGLFLPLIAALDDLKDSEDVDSLATESDATGDVVPPQAGGAVSAPTPVPVKAPAKKAPAKKAAAPAPAAPPAPVAPAANVPAAKKPGIEVVDANTPAAPGTTEPVEGGAVDTATGEAQVKFVVPPGSPTHDEGVANVLEGLPGSEVVQEPEPDGVPAVPEVPSVPEPEEVPTTPVDAPPAPPVPAAPPAPSNEAPTCGTAARNPDKTIAENPVPGCGKSLADVDRDVVNIAFIRTSREGRATWLCPACLAVHKASA